MNDEVTERMRAMLTSELIRLFTNDDYLESVADPKRDLKRLVSNHRCIHTTNSLDAMNGAQYKIELYRHAVRDEIDRRFPVIP